jgi:hypothetical protein
MTNNANDDELKALLRRGSIHDYAVRMAIGGFLAAELHYVHDIDVCGACLADALEVLSSGLTTSDRLVQGALDILRNGGFAGHESSVH